MNNSKRVEIYAYKCNTCGKIYPTQTVADICCKQYFCDTCGQRTTKYRTRCEICSDKLKYEKATKMTYDEYVAKYPNNLIYLDDNYYYDMEYLAESVIDSYDECRPRYCWGTYAIPAELSVDILTHIEEDISCEDEVEFDAKGYAEFDEFAKKWNDKYSYSVYSVDYNIVILIDHEWWE